MTESILEQSKKGKVWGRFGKKTKIVIIILALLAAGYFGYNYFYKNNSKVDLQSSQQKTATAAKGDIQLATQANGKVVAEDGVQLSFSTTGETVEKVYVKVGDMIKKGDKIAKISTTSLQRDLSDAQDNYQAALLSLSDGKAGPTQDKIKNAQYQIDQAQTSLVQSQSSLDQTEINADTKVKSAQQAIDTAKNNLKMNSSKDSSEIVDNAYSTVYTDAENLSITLKNDLYSADKILGIDDTNLNDSFENTLGVLNYSTLNSSKSAYAKAENEKNKLDSMIASTNKSNHGDMDKLAVEADLAAGDMKDLYANLQDLLDATITSGTFSQTQLDSLKSSVSSTRSSLNGTTTSLDKDVDAIETAKDSLSNLQITYDNAVTNLDSVNRQNAIDIKNAQDAVQNKNIALDEAKMSYNDLVAPLTSTELQNLTMKVHQAKNNLDKVQQSIGDATLTSPIDGEVGAINGKEGSLIVKDTTSSFATIINKDTLFVEVSVEESEISNIKMGQKAYVTFDALNGVQLEGEVTFISMTATTSNSGIVTYVVRVVLDDVGKTEVKEGMTAYVKFVSSEVKNVINIPVAAVTNVDGVPSVKMANGKYQEVVTGFTDGKTVEVISGLNEGDKVVY
jgi:RND family efflux transporter MFP subunit